MHSYLTSKIVELSPGRSITMQDAAHLFIERGGKSIVETGCYRGCGPDGYSTLLLAMLAREVNGHLTTIDISQEHIAKATELVEINGLSSVVTFICGDSVRALSTLTGTIDLLYLDSFDYVESIPWPCQRHQLAELGAAFGKLGPQSLILLDDYALPHTGKCGLSVPFLNDRGAIKISEGYQVLFTLQAMQ